MMPLPNMSVSLVNCIIIYFNITALAYRGLQLYIYWVKLFRIYCSTFLFYGNNILKFPLFMQETFIKKLTFFVDH